MRYLWLFLLAKRLIRGSFFAICARKDKNCQKVKIFQLLFSREICWFKISRALTTRLKRKNFRTRSFLKSMRFFSSSTPWFLPSLTWMGWLSIHFLTLSISRKILISIFNNSIFSLIWNFAGFDRLSEQIQSLICWLWVPQD